jgi:hypothetical protein
MLSPVTYEERWQDTQNLHTATEGAA